MGRSVRAAPDFNVALLAVLFWFWFVVFTSNGDTLMCIFISALKADLSGLSPQDIESVLRGACESMSSDHLLMSSNPIVKLLETQ